MDIRRTIITIISVILSVIALVMALIPSISMYALIPMILTIVCAFIAFIRRQSGRGFVVIAIIIVLVSGVLILANQGFFGSLFDSTDDQASQTIQRTSGEGTQDILGSDLTVDLGQFIIAEDAASTFTALPVTIQNKLEQTKSYTIVIEALDSAGNKILEDAVFAENVAGGETRQLETFTIVPSDQLGPMSSAEFRVVSVAQM